MAGTDEDIPDDHQSPSSETEWDVKQILGERRERGKRQYLVEWLDLQPNGEKWPNSWEDTCSPELIAEWEKIKALKRKQSSTSRSTSSSSRTSQKAPRRSTRYSLRGDIMPSDGRRSTPHAVRLTRSMTTSPGKRPAVQAFSSEEGSGSSPSPRRFSAKRRKIGHTTYTSQGSSSTRARSRSSKPKDDDSYEDSAEVSAIPDIPAKQQSKQNIPTDDESYDDSRQPSTSMGTRRTSRSKSVISDDEGEAEETSNSTTDPPTPPNQPSRSGSRRGSRGREVPDRLTVDSDSDSDGEELEHADAIIEPYMSPAYRSQRKANSTPVRRSTSAVVTSNKSGPPAARSGDRNPQRKFKIVGASTAVSTRTQTPKQKPGESKGIHGMQPHSASPDAPSGLAKASAIRSESVPASGVSKRGNSRPVIEHSDPIEPASSSNPRRTAPEDISAFTSTAPSGSAPLTSTGSEDISAFTSTAQSHTHLRAKLGPIPHVSQSLFHSYRAETPTSPIDQYTPSPAIRPSNSSSNHNGLGSSQGMNAMVDFQSGQMRPDDIPQDDSEPADSLPSERDKAFIADTEESVRPTADLSYDGLLDGLEDVNHFGSYQDHSLSVPTEHQQPPLADVVPSSMSDPALSVSMPVSSNNHSLSQQLAQTNELLQTKDSEIATLRRQLASINAPGGYSVLLDTKNKKIQSLQDEVTFYVEKNRQLQEDKEQNARDLATKVQHIVQMGRHREECERLEINNRHLIGNLAELKTQAENLKAEKLSMSEKIVSTEKSVTELTEAFTAYAAREDQTLGGSERAPGATPSGSPEAARLQEPQNLSSICSLTAQLRDVEAELRVGSFISSSIDVQGVATSELRIATTMDVALKDLQDCIDSLNRGIRNYIVGSRAREASLVEDLGANKASYDILASTSEQEKEELRKEVDNLKTAAAEEAVFIGFTKARYDEEKVKASTYHKENIRLLAENEAARSQAEEGVKQVRLFYQTTEEKLREELEQVHAETQFFLERKRRVASRSADGMTEDYAALQKELEDLTADAVFWKRHISLLAGSRAEANGIDADAGDDSKLPSRTLVHILDRFKALKTSAEEFRDKYNAFKQFEGSIPWEDSISRLVDIGINVDLEKDVLPSVVNDVLERYHESERRYRRAKRNAESFRKESQLQDDCPSELQPEPAPTPAPSPPLTPALPSADVELAVLVPDVGDGMYTWNMANRSLTTEHLESQISQSNSSPLPPSTVPEENSHSDSLKNGGDGTNPEISLDMEEKVYPCPSRTVGKPCMNEFPSLIALKEHLLDVHLVPKLYPTD